MLLPIMKQFLILLFFIDHVYSQNGFDAFKIFQSPFFREASKLAANINFPSYSGLSNSNSTSGCGACSIPSANDINYYTRLAQQIASNNNFPNIPTNQAVPNIQQVINFPAPDYGAYTPSTDAPPQRRPSFKYPEIKNSLNSANSQLKTIGVPKSGGLVLPYRTGK
ncbi:uncharacterized protein [Chironomus tepperi]|uniref:uncharacterized protein n=1 Tax=Chironomus tepperi TaxID=113505 RepID=UPI00391F5E17